MIKNIQLKDNKTLIQRCMLWIVMTVGLLLPSCDKADQFYHELYDKPEIIELGYRSTYELGDTLTIYGRLHLDNEISLHIGDIDAPITDKGYNEDYDVEFIKTVINETMGVGNNRSVRITSGNAYLNAPAITIYSSAGAGYLQDNLELESYFNLPANINLVNCLSGNGNVYYWAINEKKLYKVLPNGESKVLLQASDLSDEHGDYAITTFYSGAIDPAEKEFYFSALTTDKSVDNTRNFIYRLCRFNAVTEVLTTLNRTLVRKGTVKNIPTDEPLEGVVNEVNLLGVGQIYPDSEGNVYLQPLLMSEIGSINQRFATVLLTAEGDLKYILKSRISGADKEIALLPGIAINEMQGIIAPNDGLMFTNGTSAINTILGYDLKLKTKVYTLITQKPTDTSSPVIYGEFAGLSGDTEVKSNQLPSRFGFLPIGNGCLTVLYYQGMSKNIYEKFPALGVLDFPKQRGDRYAPGILETKSFGMKDDGLFDYGQAYLYNDKPTSDKMLNYDEQGMIYMTANFRSVLVKTKKKSEN